MYAFIRFPDFKKKALTFSYDDGTTSDEKLVAIFDKYNLKATFNLNSGMFGEGNRLSQDKIVKLFKGGNHEVAVHGLRHLPVSDVPNEAFTNDVIEDRKNLEKLFGKIVKGMAYANGAVTDEGVEILRHCGIKYSRTTVATRRFDLPTDWLRLNPTCHHCDPNLNDLADKFLDNKEFNYLWSNRPKLFYVWGHSYEFDYSNNWEIIENFAKKVANQKDVWYATNGEIYDYINAYNRLEYSVDEKTVYNPTDTDVYLYYYCKEICVKKGETVTVEF